MVGNELLVLASLRGRVLRVHTVPRASSGILVNTTLPVLPLTLCGVTGSN